MNTHKMVIDVDKKISHGRLFNYSKDSIYVKMAIERLHDQKKMQTVHISDFTTVPGVVTESDLLSAIFEIENESKKAGINLRKGI